MCGLDGESATIELGECGGDVTTRPRHRARISPTHSTTQMRECSSMLLACTSPIRQCAGLLNPFLFREEWKRSGQNSRHRARPHFMRVFCAFHLPCPIRAAIVRLAAGPILRSQFSTPTHQRRRFTIDGKANEQVEDCGYTCREVQHKREASIKEADRGLFRTAL